MAKVTGPLFSLDARNAIGKAIVYSYWRGVNYVRARVIPKNPNSEDQQAVRSLITDASQAWYNEDSPIDTAYKAAYGVYAEGQPFSGFNAFIKDCFGKNGGKYYDGSLDIPTEPGDNAA
jgi:hypothetical protein